MENFMNDNILKQVDNIVDIIQNSKEYQDYLFLSNKLKQNKKANTLIKEIKRIQKEIVRKEVLKEDTKELEEELTNLVSTLNQIPLYVEFIEIQKELNENYQMIKERLDDYFYAVLN